MNRKPKLTDEERHRRFVETAREIGAAEGPRSFDKAFDRIVIPPPKKKGEKPS